MKINKRRMTVVAAGVGALGAITALGLGGTSALYTSQATGQTNTIESGTIQLNNTSAVTDEIHLTGFMPGDTSQKSKYKLAYSGEDAFVGVDLKIVSTADQACSFYSSGAASIPLGDLLTNCTATGTVPMFDGDAGGSMDLTVLPENGATAHQLLLASDLNPGTACSAATGGIVSCTVEKKNVLVPPRYMSVPITADELVFHDGDTDYITLQANLPLSAPNIFQGSTVDVTLTAHAVQYANNHVPVSGFEGILPNGISGTGTQAPAHFPDTF